MDPNLARFLALMLITLFFFWWGLIDFLLWIGPYLI